MSDSAPTHRDRVLQTWRDEAGFTSWAAFSRATGLSRYRISAFRQARLERLPTSALLVACQGLNRSVSDYLNAIEPDAIAPIHKRVPEASAADRDSIQNEARWQRQTLDRLEPLLRQYPTAQYAAERSDLLARNVLALLHPLERLLDEWQLEYIGRVGDVIPYDPTRHQMLSDGAIAPGDLVEVRYVGYFYRNAVWLKAQVRSPKL
ncbi:MAG: helix-turn-helix transcriptional regulator [Cyanobacteria bacterium J06648_11]